MREINVQNQFERNEKNQEYIFNFKAKITKHIYSSNMIFVNRVGWDFTILIDSNTHLTTRMYFFVR